MVRPFTGHFSMAIGGFWQRLAGAARGERHRWPLWLPVLLGVGAALYFGLPAEPAAILGWGALAAALVATVVGIFGPWRIPLALLAALALGFGAAKPREEAVAAPVLSQAMTLHLTGRVLSVDPAAYGSRLVVGDLRSGGFAEAVPGRARIAMRGDNKFQPGEGISLTARLLPPPGPSEPGDSDFGRAAFFQGISAVGFAYGAPIPAPLAAAPGIAARIAAQVEILREAMTARIRAALPDSEGAIASALITGERGGIEPDDEAALRDAGLAHVLAIAGLHMALVGMGLFWLVRAVLAAFPAMVLNYPIKKWAACAALLGAGFYLVISGATASSTRAFVMLAMMLLAVLVDRPALSMRSLALAAALLLLWRPESVTEPGFQMSFAAVAALIAVAEWEQRRERLVPHGTLYRYLRGIFLTSLVGSIATMPFAIFTFDRATHYAVLGNLLAMPVMGFVVMPSAALGVMTMPFGLETIPLHVMGWGIDVMLAMGRFVSGLSGAVTVSRAWPVGALAAMSLGGLWLALWRTGWRWFGVIPVLAGLMIALMTKPPDLLVAADARTIAIRGSDGRLLFPRPPKDRFAGSRWLARDGDARAVKDAVGGAKCDGESCVMTAPDGSLIAMPFRLEAVMEDCARAAILISAVPAENCAGPKLILDARAVVSGGGYAITDGKALSVRAWRGERPWTRAKSQD
jgi:competence protein ComEC